MTSSTKTTEKTVSERIAALVRARSPGDMPAGSLAAAYKAAYREPLTPQAYGKEELGELLEELAAHPAAGFRTFRPPGKTHLVLGLRKKAMRQPLATLGPVQVQMRGAGGSASATDVLTLQRRTITDVLRATEQRVKRAMMSIIAIDISYSMSGERIAAALRGLRSMLEALQARHVSKDVVAIWAFGSSVTQISKFTRVSELDVDAALSKVRVDGGTALYDTLVEVLDGVKPGACSLGERTTELFLLTDGEDTSSRRSLGEAKARLAKPGIRDFHATLVSVGVPKGSGGYRALDDLSAGTKHVRHMAVGDSDKAIRDAYRTVVTQMMTRTTTTVTWQTATTGTTTTGGGAPGGRGRSRGGPVLMLGDGRGRGRGCGRGRGRGRGKGG